MPSSIACICGYRGPAVTADGASVCPICRTAAAAVSPPMAGGLPSFTPPPAPGSNAAPPSVGFGPAAASPGGIPAAPLRIPCPRGHVLDAPATMLGQRAVCPKCNEFFVLDPENSVERREQREREAAEKAARDATRWLVRAIWVAALVIVALLAMTFIATLGG
ncbi:MAG: hypothetical protein EBX36_00585 [Planctomycetia bacterium]|nr:hypothetical protein [Planctomycetia bacterium]